MTTCERAPSPDQASEPAPPDDVPHPRTRLGAWGTRFVLGASVTRVAVAAFAIRAAYGLFVHPLADHLRSDMAGYAARADKLLAAPWARDPLATFFPWGTHVLAAAAKLLGPSAWGPALGLVYALLGVVAVAATHATARALVPRRPDAANLVGLVLALYPPWIEHTGFLLSETPFTAAVACAVLASARYGLAPSWRSALALGVSIGVGAAFRPQIGLALPVAAVALAIAAWRARRNPSPKPSLRPIRAWHVALVALPLALVVAGSAIRSHYHLGRWSGISTNGAFNLALGRCHATTLSAKGGKSRYQPPALLRLQRFEEQNGFAPLFELDPALELELTLPGPAWDEGPAMELVKRCVRTTGPVRQVKFAFEHVALLWLYNVPWPTTGAAAAACGLFAPIFGVPGLVVALLAFFGGRRRALALVAAQPLSMVATAMIVFGEARLRMPYDGVLLLLAIVGGLEASAWLARRREDRTRRARAQLDADV